MKQEKANKSWMFIFLG